MEFWLAPCAFGARSALSAVFCAPGEAWGARRRSLSPARPPIAMFSRRLSGFVADATPPATFAAWCAASGRRGWMDDMLISRVRRWIFKLAWWLFVKVLGPNLLNFKLHGPRGFKHKVKFHEPWTYIQSRRSFSNRCSNLNSLAIAIRGLAGSGAGHTPQSQSAYAARETGPSDHSLSALGCARHGDIRRLSGRRGGRRRRGLCVSPSTPSETGLAWVRHARVRT